MSTFDYEDCVKHFEIQLIENLNKLLDHQHPKLESSTPCSNSIIGNNVYFAMRWSLDAALNKLSLLRSEFKNLNQRYSSLLENNFTGEFSNYLKCQEKLRLQFLELVHNCKPINTLLDKILYGNFVDELNKNPDQTASGCLRVICDNLKPAVPFDKSSASKEDLDNSSVQVVSKKRPKSNAYMCRTLPETATVTKSLRRSPADSVRTKKSHSTTFSKKPVSTAQKKATNHGRKFTRKEHHDRHQAVLHDGTKPFICTLCGMSFPRKDYLTRHILSKHMKDSSSRRYECNVCGVKYISQNAINRHKRHSCGPQSLKSNGEFGCTVCGQKFRHERSRKRHEKSVHRILLLKLKKVSGQWVRDF